MTSPQQIASYKEVADEVSPEISEIQTPSQPAPGSLAAEEAGEQSPEAGSADQAARSGQASIPKPARMAAKENEANKALLEGKEVLQKTELADAGAGETVGQVKMLARKDEKPAMDQTSRTAGMQVNKKNATDEDYHNKMKLTAAGARISAMAENEAINVPMAQGVLDVSRLSAENYEIISAIFLNQDDYNKIRDDETALAAATISADSTAAANAIVALGRFYFSQAMSIKDDKNISEKAFKFWGEHRKVLAGTFTTEQASIVMNLLKTILEK
jgi:hypothetical protein